MFIFLCQILDECKELHIAVLCCIGIYKTHVNAQLKFVSAISVHCMCYEICPSMSIATNSPQISDISPSITSYFTSCNPFDILLYKQPSGLFQAKMPNLL